MNLQTLTDDLFARLDWDPTPTTRAVQIAHRFINRALNQVVLDAPFLFYEDRFIIRTQPDAAPTGLAASTGVDTLTLEQGDVPGSIDNLHLFNFDLPGGATLNGRVVPPTDRSWDGRFLEIEDSGGVKRRVRIRSIFSRTVTKGTPITQYTIALWQPWNPDWGKGPFAKWRIFTPSYSLPDDIVEVKSLRVVDEKAPYPIEYVLHPEAEELGLAEHASTQAGGRPLVAYRSGFFRMQGPKVAPGVETYGEEAWKGPEPMGKFQYVLTYCWGKRDPGTANPGVAYWADDEMIWEDTANMGTSLVTPARNRVVEPMWESAPSPISAEITVSYDEFAPAVRLTIPNIEYALGFLLDASGGSGTDRRISTAHSGWFVRIYRRRVTEDFNSYTSLSTQGGVYVQPLKKMDFDSNFYLLAEFKIDDDNSGWYIDNGSALPDIHRPLREINGYEQVRFHPQPDAGYLVEGRAIRRPAKLVSEYDAPNIHGVASDVVVEKALSYMYERLGDQGRAAEAARRYEMALAQFKRRFGDGIPSNQPIRRRPTRFPLNSRNPKWRR